MKKIFILVALLLVLAPSTTYCADTDYTIQNTPMTGQADSQTDPSYTHWSWYITRASGLIGFALLYISILLGVSTRIPFLNRACGPLYCDNTHCWISAQALFFGLAHPFALLFDHYIGFGFKDILVPFASSYQPTFVALGIIGLYFMIILVISSYLKKYLPFIFWRLTHWISVPLYILIVIHSYYLGTDLKDFTAKIIFITLNLILVLLFFFNLYFRVKKQSALIDQNSPTTVL